MSIIIHIFKKLLYNNIYCIYMYHIYMMMLYNDRWIDRYRWYICVCICMHTYITSCLV